MSCNHFDEKSIDVSLFISKVDEDFICPLCALVPKKPYSVSCCGKNACEECITEWITKKKPECPFCRKPCHLTDIVTNPFISAKLAGLNVMCPFHKPLSSQDEIKENVALGCDKIIMFGKEGATIKAHIMECIYQPIVCPDCNKILLKKDLINHCNISGFCPKKKLKCEICELDITYGEILIHNIEIMHFINASKKIKDNCSKLEQYELEISKLNTKWEQKLTESNAQWERKLTESNAQWEKKIALKHVQMIKFEILKWSEIKDGATIFSDKEPFREWGYSFYLGVFKSANHIGLYLCCGGVGKFPIQVDHRLIIKKRGLGEIIKNSVLFHSKYEKEKSWGLAEFTTLEELEKLGGYSRSEDAITFGCAISRVVGEGLLWEPEPTF